jgi:hypothetical protein
MKINSFTIGVALLTGVATFSVVSFYLTAKNKKNIQDINSFQDCVNAGFPVMESYPRKCSTGENLFVEELDNKPKLSLEVARVIADNQKSCTKEGQVSKEYSYNNVTKTWWFDIKRETTNNDGCNPACVVFEATNSAEINWRCTGLKKE